MIALNDEGITYCGIQIYALNNLLKKLYFDDRSEAYMKKIEKGWGVDRTPRSYKLDDSITLCFQTTTHVQDYGRVIEHGVLCSRTRSNIKRNYLSEIPRMFNLYKSTNMFKYLNFIVSKLCESPNLNVLTDFPKTSERGFGLYELLERHMYWNKFSYDFTDIDVQELIEVISKMEFDRGKETLFVTTINPRFCEVVYNVVKEIHGIELFPICLLGLKRI